LRRRLLNLPHRNRQVGLCISQRRLNWARIDGLASLNLNVGKLLATAANSRAFYPNLQLNLGGNTIGRAPSGLTENSTEAEVDA
jgi:hypothetical protein